MGNGGQDEDDDPHYKPFDPFESPRQVSPTPTPSPKKDEEDTAFSRALKAIRDKFNK